MELHEQTDSQLIALLQANEAAALGELMRRYKRPIVNFCYRLLGSAAEADDVAQETFVRLHQQRDQIDPSRKFSTWLFAVARNACLDRRRWWRRRPAVPLDEAPEPAAVSRDVENRELGRAIAAAVVSLPEDQRTAIVLAEYHGLSYAEIGEIMDCSVKSVEARLYRAKAVLREKLRGFLGPAT